MTENENKGEKENELIIELSQPYSFEGEEYKQIDLSELESFTANDMIAAQRIFDRGGAVSVLPEMNLEYACIVAARVTKKPVEFFKGLPAKDAVKVKNRVSAYFFGGE